MFIATRKHHMARNRIDARTHPVPLFDISPPRPYRWRAGLWFAAFGLPMPYLPINQALRARQLRTAIAKEKIL